MTRKEAEALWAEERMKLIRERTGMQLSLESRENELRDLQNELRDLRQAYDALIRSRTHNTQLLNIVEALAGAMSRKFK